MEGALDIVTVDTDGRLLRLQCYPTSHRAVESKIVRFQRCVVRLDVLSASHRVLVGPTTENPANRNSISSPTAATWEIHETVACEAAVADEQPPEVALLPPELRWQAEPWTVDFRSELCFGDHALREAAASVIALTDRSDSLVAAFPGNELALTGLTVRSTSDDRIRWNSWHLYPGADPHVVTTQTTATSRPRRREDTR
ncbi:MAG: hypothetical protein ACI8TP_001302 [Acidimicrobiales bacterium]|jgi:hypothetical protein